MHISSVCPMCLSLTVSLLIYQGYVYPNFALSGLLNNKIVWILECDQRQGHHAFETSANQYSRSSSDPDTALQVCHAVEIFMEAPGSDDDDVCMIWSK
jgi:hypothetical protein